MKQDHGEGEIKKGIAGSGEMKRKRREAVRDNLFFPSCFEKVTKEGFSVFKTAITWNTSDNGNSVVCWKFSWRTNTPALWAALIYGAP